jgi:hypothetical protein
MALQKVLSQELSVCVARLPQSYLIEPYHKLWMQVSYIFIALEINILYRNVCILYGKVYTVVTRLTSDPANKFFG